MAWNPFRKARRPTDDEIVERVPGEPSIFGRDLRAVLGEAGFAMNGAEFYARMARLEETGRVRGWDEPRTVGGHQSWERAYRRVQADPAR
jgi:hypothetical protein